jgi:hypothetical protein
MRYHQISTVRRLIERFPDRLMALQRWQHDPDVYVSFTNLMKIGINPRSRWDTPIGIYAYPLREMFAEIAADRIPYGEAPYIQVLRSDQVIELSSYSENDLTRDIARLADKYTEVLCDEGLWNIWRPRQSEFHAMKQSARSLEGYEETFDFAMTTWAEQATHSNPASKLWNITRNMSLVLTEHKLAKANETMAKSGSVMWNTILRRLGYTAFSDKTGIGIIHDNEPVSAIFLTGTAFVHLQTVHNVMKK